nr:Chain C, EBOV-NP1 [Ebola virus sp.]6J2E_F Chain F, EBOV-NP1 [Ebola virus sp.]
DFQESADSFL